MSDGGRLSPEDDDLWRAFVTMTSQLNLRLDRQLQRDAGISQPDYAVAVVLSEARDRRLRTGELAELLGWEKSRVSHHVSRMESRGLVARTACDEDARGVWVTLTADGRRALLGATREHVATIRSLFLDVLEPAERDALRSASRRVLDRIDPPACGIAAEHAMPAAPDAVPA